MFFEEKNNRIILRVKIIPNASSLKTSGIISGPDNMDYLKIYVVSVPEKGKANKELFAFLARLLKIAKSDISLLSGETNHYKKLEISRRKILTAQIIDGRSLAQQIRETLKLKVSALKKKPHLAVVLVGNDEASLIYDRNKQKAALEVGLECNIHHLPEDIKQDELNNIVDALNKDKDVNGIIVQMPLPRHLDAKDVLKHISPEKDVDGFGVENLGLLLVNSSQALVAATPKGILKLIQSVEPHLAGKNAVIIGRSTIVGKPLAALLLNHDCSVTVLHSKSVGISDFVRQAAVEIGGDKACADALYLMHPGFSSGKHG